MCSIGTGRPGHRRLRNDLYVLSALTDTILYLSDTLSWAKTVPVRGKMGGGKEMLEDCSQREPSVILRAWLKENSEILSNPWAGQITAT